MTRSASDNSAGYVDIDMVATREELAMAAHTAKEAGRLVHQTAPRLVDDGRYRSKFRLTSPAY